MSSSLSKDDVMRIASAVSEKLTKEQSFYIDPERHYREHSVLEGLSDDQIRTLHDIIKAYSNARSLFWKAFLGLAVVGSLVMTAVGLGFHKGP